MSQSQAQQELDQKVLEAISDITEEPEQIDAIDKIREHYRVEDGSRYYQLVQSYMSREIDLPEAMNELFVPIYRHIDKFDTNELQFFDLWHSIFQSAKRISFEDTESHQRLVEFLAAYKKQPHPRGMYNGHGPGGIFGSLYGFSYTVMSYWGDEPGHGSGYTEPEVRAWANLNYHWACVVKTDISDLWLRCISAMRSALEDIMREKRVSKKFTAIQLYNSLVPAAAVWVFALRGELYERDLDMTRQPGSKMGNYAYGGKLYDGPSGFNKTRWRLWKKRFGEISQLKALNAETRKLAKEAFDIMEESEPSVPEPRYELRSIEKRPADSATA